MTAYAPRAQIDLEWIVRNMVGDNYDLGSPPTGYEKGHVVLDIDDLSVAAPGGAYSVVDRLSLQVRAGEIVCIYGLMGAGRTEMMECVGRSARRFRRPRPAARPGRFETGHRAAHRSGLVLVPEDRQRDGLVQTMSVGQNLSLASIRAFARHLFSSRQSESELIERSIRDVHIKTDGGDAMIGSLSGGNQQKVVIGKMLATNPAVVLLDEPSRGIDIGAKAEVFKLLAEGAKRGLAVVYSTSEVGECLSIAHRIIVMARGKISAEFGTGRDQRKDHGRLRRGRSRIPVEGSLRSRPLPGRRRPPSGRTAAATARRRRRGLAHAGASAQAPISSSASATAGRWRRSPARSATRRRRRPNWSR